MTEALCPYRYSPRTYFTGADLHMIIVAQKSLSAQEDNLDADAWGRNQFTWAGLPSRPVIMV